LSGLAEEAEAVTTRPPRQLGLVAAVAASVLVVDQLSKTWALNRLTRGSIHLFWTLDLRLTRNTGASFSIGSGQGLGPVITVLALVVIGVLVAGTPSRSRLGAVAVGMVAGGALGNLADRAFREGGFLHGGVVDFIDLRWWPVFNVADSAVVIGALLLVVRSMRPEEPSAGATSGP
jgi:signal peptidase II